MVAKEIKKDKREDLFAATPPLEALKVLLSLAMIEGIGYERGREEDGVKLEFIDIKRAYLQAEVKREIYVELPGKAQEEGKCARLKKAMYGSTEVGGFLPRGARGLGLCSGKGIALHHVSRGEEHQASKYTGMTSPP